MLIAFIGVLLDREEGERLSSPAGAAGHAKRARRRWAMKGGGEVLCGGGGAQAGMASGRGWGGVAAQKKRGDQRGVTHGGQGCVTDFGTGAGRARRHNRAAQVGSRGQGCAKRGTAQMVQRAKEGNKGIEGREEVRGRWEGGSIVCCKGTSGAREGRAMHR